MSATIRVTVWTEARQDQRDEAVKAVYPNGIGHAIAAGLNAQPGLTARTATLDDPDQGLPEALLDQTDVLIYWSHLAHDEVRDEFVRRVHRRVLAGMGLIVLHSAAARRSSRR